jgi:hypothetical protein
MRDLVVGEEPSNAGSAPVGAENATVSLMDDVCRLRNPVRTVGSLDLALAVLGSHDSRWRRPRTIIEALSPDGAHEPLTGWDDVIGTHTMRAATSILEWRVVPRNNVVPVAYALVPPR